MPCPLSNILKIRPIIKDNKKYVSFYPCCTRFGNYGKDTLIEISKIKDVIKNGNFENFINSYTKDISCANGNGNCSQNLGKEKFDGIATSLGVSCNLNCSFCAVKETRKVIIDNNYSDEYNELYFLFLNEIIKSNFTKLKLSDHGEPLAIPGTFEFLENIPNDSKLEWIQITTNGTLINDRLIEIIKKHPKIKFEITISLNTYNRESYKDIMGVDKFDLVLNNIKNLINLSYSIPNLKLPMITFALTEEVLVDFENLFKFIDEEIKTIVKVNIAWGIENNENYFDLQPEIDRLSAEHNEKYWCYYD